MGSEVLVIGCPTAVQSARTALFPSVPPAHFLPQSLVLRAFRRLWGRKRADQDDGLGRSVLSVLGALRGPRDSHRSKGWVLGTRSAKQTPLSTSPRTRRRLRGVNVKRRTKVQQWTHVRGCSTGPPLPLPAPSERPDDCAHPRRSTAAPPALSIRPPLPASPFCATARPVVIRAWRCPRAASRW
jgi:hypothetical protein